MVFATALQALNTRSPGPERTSHPPSTCPITTYMHCSRCQGRWQARTALCKKLARDFDILYTDVGLTVPVVDSQHQQVIHASIRSDNPQVAETTAVALAVTVRELDSHPPL